MSAYSINTNLELLKMDLETLKPRLDYMTTHFSASTVMRVKENMEQILTECTSAMVELSFLKSKVDNTNDLLVLRDDLDYIVSHSKDANSLLDNIRFIENRSLYPGNHAIYTAFAKAVEKYFHSDFCGIHSPFPAVLETHLRDFTDPEIPDMSSANAAIGFVDGKNPLLLRCQVFDKASSLPDGSPFTDIEAITRMLNKYIIPCLESVYRSVLQQYGKTDSIYYPKEQKVEYKQEQEDYEEDYER